MVREGFQDGTRCGDETSENCGGFTKWYTDDPWFSESRYNSTNGVTDFSVCNSSGESTLYAELEPDFENCKTLIDNLADQNFGEHGNLNRDEVDLSEATKCWKNAASPDKYQNMKNMMIPGLDEFNTGIDTYQPDCMSVQCDSNNTPLWESLQCNNRFHVPVCRIPLVSCKPEQECVRRTENTKFQFCGDVTLQANARPFWNENIYNIVQEIVNLETSFQEPSLRGQVKEFVTKNDAVLPNNISPENLSSSAFDENKHEICPCEACDCLETSPLDSTWGASNYAFNYFRRYTNGVLQNEGTEYEKGQNTMDFSCFGDAQDVTPNADFRTKDSDNNGFLSVNCKEEFEVFDNKITGNHNTFFYENGEPVSSVVASGSYAYQTDLNGNDQRMTCSQRFDDFCETVQCSRDSFITESNLAAASLVGKDHIKTNNSPLSLSDIGTEVVYANCRNCHSGDVKLVCTKISTSKTAEFQIVNTCTEIPPCNSEPVLPNNAVSVSNSGNSCGSFRQAQCSQGFVSYVNGIKSNQNIFASSCSNSQFSSFNFECRQLCFDPNLENNVFINPIFNWQSAERGDSVTVTCQNGYFLSTPQTITCDDNYRFPASVCDKLSCKSLPEDLKNGYCYDLEGKTSWAGDDSENTVVCRCNKCRRMFKNQSLRSNEMHDLDHDRSAHFQYVRRKCSGDTWESIDGQVTCPEFECGNPPFVENADINYDAENKANALCGELITYTCKSGYSGSPIASCGEKGYFTVSGVCVATTCDTGLINDLPNIPDNVIGNASFVVKNYQNYHEISSYNAEIQKMSSTEHVPVGTQGLFECLPDFVARPKHNFIDITCDVNKDVSAGNGEQDDSLCVDDFDQVLLKSVGNDKLRSECLADGTWSEFGYECVCAEKLERLRAERFRRYFMDSDVMLQVCPAVGERGTGTGGIGAGTENGDDGVNDSPNIGGNTGNGIKPGESPNNNSENQILVVLSLMIVVLIL